ncbi:MAG TPA: hypothetical protein VM076_15595 [Gemmatimonadaceae bacterium]|nr:hypothetical protein [Gemmatimonadaceae bacterium]
MQTIRRRSVAVAALFGVLLAGRVEAQARWATLDEFLTGGIRLSAQEMAALARGETVARMLPTGDGDDVAVFGAVRVNIPRSFFAERQADVTRALRTPTRVQVQRFSEPAVPTDVQALRIGDDDLKELRGCRPGDCNFKLPATDMERFRATIASAPDARSRVATYAAQRMVEYVNDYRSRGNAAMLVFDDRGTVHASDALVALLQDSSFAFTVVPSLGRHLVDYPRSTLAGATEVIFWSNDEMPHLRPVLRITHQTTFSPPERSDLTIIASKQIYANHYFEAGLEVLGAMDRAPAGASPGSAGITLVAVRRYRFDHLPRGGLLNIRSRVSNGLRDNVRADLDRLKRDGEAAWAASRR